MAEELVKLWEPSNGVMRVAGMMSGTGSNLVKLIEHEERARNYHITLIVSDTPQSNAVHIAETHRRPLLIHDLRAFCADSDKPVTDKDMRSKFDALLVEALDLYRIDVVALAGYNWEVSSALYDGGFVLVNVHPGDLRVVGANEKRSYTGLAWVPSAKAILNDEKTICSTVHLVTEEIDAGPILMTSPPLEVTISDGDYQTIKEAGVSIKTIKQKQKSNTPLTDEERLLVDIAIQHQNRLKEHGDWLIFPKTLELIAAGRFVVGKENGRIYFDGKAAPQGVEYHDQL